MDEKMTQLEERIERLERRSQWLMLLAVGLGVLAVSIWKGGDFIRRNEPEAKAVPNIYAGGFALVDAEGRERVVLKLQDRGPVQRERHAQRHAVYGHGRAEPEPVRRDGRADLVRTVVEPRKG